MMMMTKHDLVNRERHIWLGLATRLSALPVADVTVDDLVGLALLAELAGGLDRVLRAVLLEVLVRHDLTTDELVLEVRVDDTSSLRSLDAFADGPSTNLVGASGEVADEVKRSVTRGGDLAKSRRVLLAEAKLLTLLSSLLVAHRDKTLLEGNREGNELVSRVVLVDPRLDLGQPLVLFPDVVTLRKVDKVGDGLGGKEVKTVDDLDLYSVSIVTSSS